MASTTAPWSGQQQQQQQQQQQRRAFGDVRSRAAAAENNNNSTKSSSASDAKNNLSAGGGGPAKSFGSRSSKNHGDNSSIVAKFGAMYGGTKNAAAADKENADDGIAAEQVEPDNNNGSSTNKPGPASRSSSTSRGGAGVTSPNFQSLRDAFQKRSEYPTRGESRDRGGRAPAPRLSDGFQNNSQNANTNGTNTNTSKPASNASRRERREQQQLNRSKSQSKSRNGIDVYDEGIETINTATRAAEEQQQQQQSNDNNPVTSPQVVMSKSKLKKMEKTNVRLKSEAWEKGVKLQQTQSALYDLKKENDELKMFTKMEMEECRDDKAVQTADSSESASGNNKPSTANVGTSTTSRSAVKVRSLGVGTVNTNNDMSTPSKPDPTGMNSRQNSVASSLASSSPGDTNSEVESVRLRLQNKELKAEVASLRATVAMADMAVSDTAESNTRELRRLKAELHATRTELDAVKGAAGQGEMYGKLRKNLEAQADKLTSQLDAERLRNRKLERDFDEYKASTAAKSSTTSSVNTSMEKDELKEDLSAAMADVVEKEAKIKKLQAELKAAKSVTRYDGPSRSSNANVDPISQRDAEIHNLRRSLNEFKSLHSDCDVKATLLAEQETKLKSAAEEIRAANARTAELEQTLAETRNTMMLLQNESARHLEKSIKAKEQNTMQQWSTYKKQEAALRAEIASRDEELDEARRDVTLLESKLEEAEHLIAATVERVDGLKGELSKKNVIVEEASQAVEMLDAKLSIADANAVVAEKTIGDLEHQLKVAENQKMEILTGLEKSATQIDELNQMVEDKVAELKAAREELKKEVCEGKSQNKVLYDSLQQSAERVSELQKTTQEKDAEIAALVDKVDEMDDNYNALQKFMERGTEQIESLEAELKKKEDVERDYKVLQSKYQEAVASLEQASKEAVENSAHMRSLLENKQKELQEMSKQLDVAKVQAEDAHEYQSIIEDLEEKVGFSEKVITEHETKIASLTETVEEQEEQMQEHCDRITASAREMQTVLEDAGNRQSTLEKALTELDGELQESVKLNEEHEATIKKMEGLFQEYEEKLTSAGSAVETQKKSYEDQIELLRKVNEDMESIHQSLRGEVAEREGELHASTHKVGELEKAVSELNKNLSEKQDELERTNSEFSESVSKATSEIVALTEARDGLAKELAACQTNLHAATANTNQYEATIKDLNQKLEVAATKLAADSEDTVAFKNEMKAKDEAVRKLETERDALLKDIARIAEEKATAETDYHCLEDTVEMYKITLENAENVSREKIKSREEQLLDAERTHADAEAELDKAMASKKALEIEMEEMKSAMKKEVNQLKAEIAKKEEEISNTKTLVAAMEPVVSNEQADSSIDGDIAVKNADLAHKLEEKNEELENMRVCLDYLKERVTKANDKNDKLKKEVRQMMQRNSVLENELREEGPGALSPTPAVPEAVHMMKSPDCVAIQQERQQIENEALMKYVAHRQAQQQQDPYEEDADPRC